MRFQLVKRGVWRIEVYYHLGTSEIPNNLAVNSPDENVLYCKRQAD